MTEKKKNKGGRPKGSRKFTPEELDKKIEEFFEFCKTENKPVTITGLACFIEIDRKSLLNYKRDNGLFPSIKKALMACEEYAERRLFTSQQCTGAIFTLKNNYGWKDVKEEQGSQDIRIHIIDRFGPPDPAPGVELDSHGRAKNAAG